MLATSDDYHLDPLHDDLAVLRAQFDPLAPKRHAGVLPGRTGQPQRPRTLSLYNQRWVVGGTRGDWLKNVRSLPHTRMLFAVIRMQ
jgi:hypothetical protein